jgi:hypothetical protein
MMKNIGFRLFRREDMVSYLEPMKMSIRDDMPPGMIFQGAARGTSSGIVSAAGVHLWRGGWIERAAAATS